jgi:hypothetical protein
MAFWRSSKGKTRGGKIRNEIFGEVGSIQNLLVELRDK